MTNSEEMRAIADRFGPAYDELVTPFTTRFGEDAVRLAGVRSGMRVLDVAAGGGAFSIPAARAGAEVLATDISPVVLERLAARARDADVAIETRAMDGHALDLDDDTFDVTGSQFGIMLFPDRAKALSELSRVTKPRGAGVVVGFGEPSRVEVFSFFLGAMQTAIPGFTPPPNFPIFSFKDPAKLRQEMSDAGFREVRVETVQHSIEVASGKQHWQLLTSVAPPVAGMVANLPEDRQSAVQQALDGMLRERAGDGGGAMLRMEANVGIGKK
jgi:ubiquinone/menaquinone biosynthesis C-methylase UbiE